MKQALKKALAIILTVIMLMTVMNTSLLVSAESPETVNSLPIVLGEEQTANIEEGGQRVYFSFVPEISASYTFASFADQDTYGYIYDENLQEIEYNDDGGKDSNFTIEYYLEAGIQYYFCARFYSAERTGSFSVKLSKTLGITNIDFKPVKVIENHDGYIDQVNTEEGVQEFFRYTWWYSNCLKYTVTFEDGSQTTGEGNSFYSQAGTCYDLSYEDNQSYTTSWTKGNHYTTNISVLGYETTVDVEVVGSPIESIAVQPIKLIENFDGYISTDPENDEAEYFHYNWANGDNLKYTVTFKDGRTIKDSGTEFYDEQENKYYNLSCSDNQSSTASWLKGNHYTTNISVLGYETTVDVEVVGSPVASIVVQPIKLIENYDGYTTTDDNEEEYFCYTWWYSENLKYTITLKDGRTLKGSGTEFYDEQEDKYYSLNRTDNQSSATSWIKGNHYAPTISVLGYETTVDVEVVGSPVDSIVVQPIKLIENYDGYTTTDDNGEEYFCYTWWYSENLKYTITLKDGRTLEGNGTEIYDEQEDKYYSVDRSDNQSSINQWTVGNKYTETISILGYETTVNVEVVGSPVDSIVVQPIKLIENYDGYTTTDDNEEEYFRYQWWYSRNLKYTVNFKNGRTLEGSGTGFYDEQEDKYYNLEYIDPQSSIDSWTVGNAYTATIGILGYETNVSIEIIETPVQSVAVDTIQLTENVDGELVYDGENNDAEYYRYVWWYSQHLRYKITLKDGRTFEGSGTEFYDEQEGRYYDIFCEDNQSSVSPWTVGNTYTASISVLGYNAPVNVEIVGISANEIELDTENIADISTNGKTVYYSFVPEESGFYIFESFADNMDTYGLLFDADFNQIESNDGGSTGSNFSIKYNLEAGTQYYFAARFYSTEMTGSFPVILSKAPVITNIEFKPVEMIANDTSYGSYTETEESGLFFNYYWWNLVSYTVTIDGNKVTGKGTSFEYNGKMYSLNNSDNQYSEHWTVGNTYNPTVTIFDYETTCSVSIITTPVKSITFEPISLIEGLTGEYCYDWNEETNQEVKWFRYNWKNSISYKITFKNGTTYTGSDRWINYNGADYYINIGDDQSWDNQWTVGNTYDQTVSILGYEATIPISITEIAIKKIEANAVTLIENTNGYWEYDSENGKFYCYYLPDFYFKITFANGTVGEIRNNWLQYQGAEYYVPFGYNDPQSSTNKWVAGKTYNVPVTVLGKTAYVPVKVIESPIKSIDVKPIVIPAQTGEAYGKKQYYWRNTDNVSITVNYKNGARETYNEFDDEIIYKDRYYWFETSDNQWEENWIPGGTYTATVSVLGFEAPVSITISEHPVTANNTVKYIIQNESAIITGLLGTGESITLPEKIEGYPVVAVMSLSGGEYNEVIIPDSVTSISSDMLIDAVGIEKLTIGAGITALNTYTFRYADSLKEITVSKDNREYVSIEGIVYNKELTRMIGIPNAKTEAHVAPNTVTDVNAYFNGNYTFTLDLNNTGTGYITEDGIIYNSDKTIVYSCLPSREGTYNMPDSVKVIASEAFTGTNLTEITVSNNVSDISYYSFAGSLNLEKVVLPEGLKSISVSAFANCRNLTDVNLPTSLTTIDESAFACTALTSVTIPAGIKKIATEAFSWTNITELNLPEGLVEIGPCAFAAIDISHLKLPNSLKVLGYGAFCESDIKTVDLGKGLEYIGDGAFGDSWIEEVHIPSNVKHLGNGAFSSSNLKNITFDEGLTELSDYAFRDTNLTSIDVPESVTDIGYFCFADSKNLLTIDLPNNLEKLDGLAFHGTAWYEKQANGTVYIEKALYNYKGNMPANTKITVKSGTKIIADYSLINQTNLKTVVLPKSVKTIGYGAFAHCTGLTDVYYAGSKADRDKLIVENENIELYDATWHYNHCEHTYNSGVVTKKATCKATGVKTYTCTQCGSTKTSSIAKVSHAYKTTTTKATTSKNGKVVKACSSCGIVASTSTIYYAKTVKLSTTSYTYNGKAKKPSVSVKDSKGKTISTSNYTVKYASGCEDIGKYKVTVTFKGNYSGSKTLYFTINPKIKLSATEYTYNGKEKKPTVTVTNSSGKKLSTKYYSVSYSSGRKNVGEYTVTIKFKNGHSGTYKETFVIVPKETSISKLSAAKKSFKITVKKQSTQTTGYQIQYSTSKKFTSSSTKTISSYKTTSATIKSLKANKTYYVRVRTYKTVSGDKYYSEWSKVKSIKTK